MKVNGYVESDLRNLGIRRWRKKALNRTEWAPVMTEAKATPR
jgi:hypothetical protein